MRRLYFLVPDAAIGKAVVDELLLAHVEWRHIHVVAKRGELLVIVDVPRDRVDEVTERIHKMHANIEVEATEPRVPAFP